MSNSCIMDVGNNNSSGGRVIVDGKPYLTELSVDVTSYEETVKQVVLQILFSEGDDCVVALQDLLKVSIVSGGITNNLYLVSGLLNVLNHNNNTRNNSNILDGMEDAVLVRVFGAEGMIDRDIENPTFAALANCSVPDHQDENDRKNENCFDGVTTTIATRTIAPKYYGRFQNGRIEQWLGETMRPLNFKDISNTVISKGIAKEVAKLHTCFQLPEYLYGSHNPSKPCLWDQLHSWLQQATDSFTTIPNKFQSKEDYQRAITLYEKFIKESVPMELQIMKKTITTQLKQGQQPKLAFCHNDLLAANILYSDIRQQIQLIDFEYGGINYISFDIANHFNEYAGGTEDGQTNYDLFPSVKHQTLFIKTYLEEQQTIILAAAAAAAPTTSTESDAPPQIPLVTEQMIHETLQEVRFFVLVNHLYWGLWAMNQAAIEGCRDFDYILYCQNRLEQYFKYKQEEKIELLLHQEKGEELLQNGLDPT